jgi:hypothetical protein
MVSPEFTVQGGTVTRNNMDDFIGASALILDTLYRKFPQTIPILKVVDLTDFGEDKNKFRNFRSTLVFLQKEGFIRYGKEAGRETGMFPKVELTLKGLEVLNSVPAVLKEKKPLGEHIGKALKEGSTELIKSLIQQVIHKGVETWSAS